MKKLTIATAISSLLGVSSALQADTISITFNGLFSLGSSSGEMQLNSDASSNQDYGFRTNISGAGILDTTTGSGSLTITPFSFFGAGLMAATNVTLQAIGDGAGGPGTLVAGAMGLNWNGSTGWPVTAVFDAAGFMASIGAPGTTWTVGTGCVGCATSSTADWSIGPASGSVGAVPIAMTTFNTAGTTLGSLFPLSADGISGSPALTPPTTGFNYNFDFTSITATNVVPVPAAVWLFASGLAGLVGIARRRRRSGQ